MTSPRTLLLPGMGADGRLFPEAWSALPGATRLAWPEWKGETTLGEVADRLIREYGISPTDTLVGVSLGGMIACEIANRVPVAGLVLIGSASHPDGVSKGLRAIHGLIGIVPLRFVQRCCRNSRAIERRMFADTDPDFLRAMCRAIFRWEGLRSDCPVKPFRIHGKRDAVIPCPADADVVIDAGHMVSVTHPAACVAAVGALLATPASVSENR